MLVAGLGVDVVGAKAAAALLVVGLGVDVVGAEAAAAVRVVGLGVDSGSGVISNSDGLSFFVGVTA